MYFQCILHKSWKNLLNHPKLSKTLAFQSYHLCVWCGQEVNKSNWSDRWPSCENWPLSWIFRWLVGQIVPVYHWASSGELGCLYHHVHGCGADVQVSARLTGAGESSASGESDKANASSKKSRTVCVGGASCAWADSSVDLKDLSLTFSSAALHFSHTFSFFTSTFCKTVADFDTLTVTWSDWLRCQCGGGHSHSSKWLPLPSWQ